MPTLGMGGVRDQYIIDNRLRPNYNDLEFIKEEIIMIVKTCKIHGDLTEEQIIKEKSSSSKLGYRIRCHQCRLDKDRKWKLNNLDKHRASASRARNETRRLYRQGLIDSEPKANIWIRKDREKNPEKYLKREEKSRKKQGQSRNTREVCRRIDIEVAYYYQLIDEQNNVCKICGNEETRKSRTEGKICALAIDHCHKCEDNGHEGIQIIRGLLCHSCNLMLGASKDNIDILQSAIDYLKQHNCE
jgi:hypothetical protein